MTTHARGGNAPTASRLQLDWLLYLKVSAASPLDHRASDLAQIHGWSKSRTWDIRGSGPGVSNRSEGFANRSEGLGARPAQALLIKVKDGEGRAGPGPVDKSEGLGAGWPMPNLSVDSGPVLFPH